MKLIVGQNDNPGIILSSVFKAQLKAVEEGKTTKLVLNSGSEVEHVPTIGRMLARTGKNELYTNDILKQSEVDHFMRVGARFSFDRDIAKLDSTLLYRTFVVGNELTVADYLLYAFVRDQAAWSGSSEKFINVNRWFNHIQQMAPVKQAKLAEPAKKSDKKAEVEITDGGRKKEGTFVELPGAEMGKVVTRFPPEASGYLHIGHAKAALLNAHYQRAFKGKLVFRFDDTNPAKEKEDFEKIILEDVKLLKIKPDMFTYTSDHFPLMLKYCDQMIKEGKAFCDNSPPEVMTEQRTNKLPSACRGNSVETNMKLWQGMQDGTVLDTCVRAKIDYASNNGALRDPVIYRVKHEAHPRHGNKYRVYPTYDFACPIVDSVEGVTHALRTTEYLDRDDQYFWFIDNLNIRKPHVWAYSRLNLQNTVLSKRKLTYFVDEGVVDGWDDPRMPTVRGVLRRGMTVEGLTEFILAQGSSRAIVTMEWDKIWSFNKKVIDPIAPRHFGLLDNGLVKVNVTDAVEKIEKAPFHPKNAEVGEKDMFFSKTIFIESADAEGFKEGENVTFINWGNLLINKVNKANGKITGVDAKLNLDNKDFKKTMKVTWLAEHPKNKLTPAVAVDFDNIMTKAILEKDDDFKSYINRDSRRAENLLCDQQLRDCKEGDIIQIQRRGFYRVDVPYKPANGATFQETPAVLFSIPDGRTKEVAKTGAKQASQPAKEQVRGKGSKKSAPAKAPAAAEPAQASGDALALWKEVTAYGDAVRELKTAKAAKDQVTAAVNNLLDAKKNFKAKTGQDYDAKKKPTGGASSPAAAKPPTVGSSGDLALWEEVNNLGTAVRDLKVSKAPKDQVTAAVNKLLEGKKNFKAKTGKDYDANKKPAGGASPAPAQAAPASGASGDLALWEEVTKLGQAVRDLKAAKAPKEQVTAAVTKLIDGKKNYKAKTGNDYDANKKPAGGAAPAATQAPTSASSGDLALWESVTQLGDAVRQLKSAKAPKDQVTAAVNKLLVGKKEFKAKTGADYDAKKKPAGGAPAAPASASVSSGALAAWEATTAQGNAVRDLKSKKASKDEIMAAVGKLKELKESFKKVAGSDYDANKKPAGGSSAAAPVPAAASAASPHMDLWKQTVEQGDKVRKLKAEKASKDDVTAAVNELKDRKAKYEAESGQKYDANKPPTGGAAAAPAAKPAAKPARKEKAPKQAQAPKKGETRLGLEAKKDEDLPTWFQQTITKAGLIEYYDVSGCYVLLPPAFNIWEHIKDFFDKNIKDLGVENCYFPMFVSQAALEKEKEHIEDFAPEVAWVTKSGDTELAEPIAIRPTSETVMYPIYAKRCQSHRDLPIKMNQWCNVVRWEFKHPTPFLRTREFLWQEGHSAFATKAEAEVEVMQILDLYRQVYEDLLAIPTVPGRKTIKEKFAGGDYTTTVEAYIKAAGRAIQGATSHHLGQNFSKMFNISFEDESKGKGIKEFAYQNSWGITTRTIGVLIMVHADDKGLVIPPKVSRYQAVIVPCGATKTDEDKAKLFGACKDLENQLKSFGIRAHADLRDDKKPGWKFNDWELKGVPLRIEVGPKDLEANSAVFVRRDTLEKVTHSGILTVPFIAKNTVLETLDNIQTDMFKKAKKELDENVVRVETTDTNDAAWGEFCAALSKGKLIQAPYCNNPPCEDQIKELSSAGLDVEAGAPSMGAKGLCIPFAPKGELKETEKCCICPGCSAKPKAVTMFGRSY